MFRFTGKDNTPAGFAASPAPANCRTAQRPAPPVPPAPAKYRIARRRAPAARPRRATASAEHPGQSIGRAAGRHPSRLRDRTHTAHDAAHPDRSLPRSVTRRRTRTAQPPIRSAPSPLPGTKKTTGGRKSVPMVHSRSSVARHNPPSHPPPRGLRSEPVRSTTRSTSGSNRFVVSPSAARTPPCVRRRACGFGGA